MTDQLAAIIDAAWDARDTISSATQGEVREAVQVTLNGLDDGFFRVADKSSGVWQVNQWLKKAVLLSFRLNDNAVVDGGSAGAPGYDKVPSKFAGWSETRFREAGFRVVPGAVARHGARLFEAGRDALGAEGWPLADASLVIPHQASGAVGDAVATHFALPRDRVSHHGQRVGNLGSASIWAALCDAYPTLAPGDSVLVLGAEATQYSFGGFALIR